MEKLADRLDIINEYTGRAVSYLALMMLIAQFLVVILRYVFGFTSIFLNDSVLYFHATLFMLGAGYTLLHGGHVRVDIFYAKWSKRNKAWLDIFGFLFFLCPSLIVLIVYTRTYVGNSWKIMEKSPVSGGIDAVFWLKTLVPLFAILLLIQGFSCFLRNVITVRATR